MEDLYKYKILLVDDRQENLFALSAVLKTAGYLTDSALSGSEALKLLLKTEYGLIILDVQMPEMNGFELAELIKGNSKTKDIPLIFLSANATQKEYFKQGHELGALDYLAKPVDETLLKLKINNFLEVHHSNLMLKKLNKDYEEKAIYANISYQDLYLSLSQEVFLINKEGIVVNINRTGKLTCGIFAEDIMNKQFSLSPFLNEIFEKSNSKFSAFFEQSQFKHTIDFKIEKEENVFFYGEANISIALIQGIPHLQISISDSTDNKEKEKKLQLNLKEIENTEKINQSIIRGDTIQEFSSKLLHSLNDIIEVKSARIYSYDEKKNILELITDKIDNSFATKIEKASGLKLSKVIPSLKAGSTFKKMVDDKEAIITSDEKLLIEIIEEHSDNVLLKKLSSWTQKLMNIKTFGILPIVSNDILLGMITFSSTSKLTNDEKEVIIRFSKKASLALTKKQDELKLAQSEERFKLAMQGANEGLWDWKVLTDEVYFSPVWKNMLGYKENELKGEKKTWENLLHKDDKEYAIKTVDNYIKGNTKIYESEFRLKHKEGHYVNILNRGHAIRDSNGIIYRMIGTHVDVTQSKKNDLFLKQINDSLSVKTGSSYFSEFTKFCCETVGVKYALVGIFSFEKNEVDTISFRADNAEVHDYKYKLENTPCDVVLKGGDCSYSNNIQNYFPKDETLKKFGIISYLGIPLMDENKLPIGIIALMDDKPMEDILYKEKLLRFLAPRTTNELISIKIAKQLKESETFSKGILSSLSSQIAVIDSNGFIISTNEAWNVFAEIESENKPILTGVGVNYFDVCNNAINKGDSYSEKALNGIKSVLSSEINRFDMEYPCHSLEKEQWFLLSVSSFDGGNQKAVIRHIDITERKKNERKIRDNEERYRNLFERNLAGVYRADLEDVILECNDAFAQIIGFKTAKDVIGKHARELYDNISLQDFVRKVSDNNFKINGLESSIRLKNGKQVYLLENASIIKNEKGEGMYMEGTIFDITDRKIIESQLKKTVNELINKNNDLMQFNYIVSHNLRAPIANILGLVNVLNYPNNEKETKKIIEYIGQSIIKMDDLVKDLNEMLAIRSLISSKKETVIIKKVIESVFHSIEKQRIESNAKINIDISSDAKEILTIKSYFESILYNLISNAIKYKSPLRQLELSISIKKENDKFKIKISDNGIGIDLEANGKHIFGLYKRFNIEQEGKGLGLYMVKKQIEAINGEISLESEIDKGTTFLITL
jgi:PAS domain S-box-containing protein